MQIFLRFQFSAIFPIFKEFSLVFQFLLAFWTLKIGHFWIIFKHGEINVMNDIFISCDTMTLHNFFSLYGKLIFWFFNHSYLLMESKSMSVGNSTEVPSSNCNVLAKWVSTYNVEEWGSNSSDGCKERKNVTLVITASSYKDKCTKKLSLTAILYLRQSKWRLLLLYNILSNTTTSFWEGHAKIPK